MAAESRPDLGEEAYLPLEAVLQVEAAQQQVEGLQEVEIQAGALEHDTLAAGCTPVAEWLGPLTRTYLLRIHM